MTPSVYVVGGAATGKSTFMGQLLDQLDPALHYSPLTNLHATPNARGTIITLRGHALATRRGNGLYLGVLRDEFPGTDGLDRASSIAGEAWLEDGWADLFPFIVAEGATLATRRFIGALHKHTDLLLVHLTAEPWLKELRCLQRGSEQAESFVLGTATRAANLVRDMEMEGATSWHVDTDEPEEWDAALERALNHISRVR